MMSVELSRYAADSTARENTHCFTLYYSDTSRLAMCTLTPRSVQSNYTLHEVMGAMEQVLLLASHGNHEGNLKNGRTYLQ
jgi:hypothetical protein